MSARPGTPPRPDPPREPARRHHRLAAHLHPRRSRRRKFRSPLDRGLRLAGTASAPARRSTSSSAPIPPSPFVIDLYRLGYYQGKGGRHVAPARAVRRQGPADAAGRRRAPARVPVGDVHHARRSRRTGSAASTSASCRRRSTATRATSSSSSATTGRPTSCSSAATTPGRRTTPGPTATRSTTTTARTAWSLVSGVKVSYDRPYGKYVQIYRQPAVAGLRRVPAVGVPAGLLDGAARLRRHLLLQRRRPRRRRSALHARKAFLSVGHDEYWSRAAVRPRHGGGAGRRQRRVPLGQHLLLRDAVLAVDRRACRTASSRGPAATAASGRTRRRTWPTCPSRRRTRRR